MRTYEKDKVYTYYEVEPRVKSYMWNTIKRLQRTPKLTQEERSARMKVKPHDLSVRYVGPMTDGTRVLFEVFNLVVPEGCPLPETSVSVRPKII